MPPRAKKVATTNRKPRKKYEKKRVREQHPCLHCGQIFDFPVGYCDCCKQHSHVMFMDGYSERGWCLSCEDGRSPQSQKWMREHRVWNGPKGIPAAYDRPEFYDGDLEIKNMTVMPVWVNYESGNAF